ncbi:MAG: GldG family protein [Candidatus Methylacidiphilales bacterium]
MSTKNQTASEPSRLQWQVNHYVGLSLILLIFVAVNFISHKRYYRKNISSSNYTQITDLSRNLVGALPGQVTIYHYVSPQDDPSTMMIISDVERLLEEYAYYGGQNVVVKKVDPYLDFELARKVSEQFKIALQENVVVVQFGDQNKILNYRELAQISGLGMYSQSAPKVEAFLAEQKITSAIQSLVQEKKSVVYFLSGHGEYDPEAPAQDKLGYSMLKTHIERQNAEVRSLNLISQGGIPEDANLIVVAGPRQKLSQEEIEMIRAYVTPGDNRTGRLMVLLDPGTQTGLEKAFESLGVVFRNDRAMTRVMILGQVRLLGEAIVTEVADHPSTQWMQGRQLNMGLGASRSIEVMSGTNGAVIPALPLLRTPDSFWGETDLDYSKAEFNESSDHKGPLTVAALVDEGTVSGGQVSLKGDRIAFFGGAEFLTNEAIQGNQLDLFLNMMNWMLDKQESLGISPKLPEEFSVQLDDRQRAVLSGLIILLIPALGLASAFAVWFKRRR